MHGHAHKMLDIDTDTFNHEQEIITLAIRQSLMNTNWNDENVFKLFINGKSKSHWNHNTQDSSHSSVFLNVLFITAALT